MKNILIVLFLNLFLFSPGFSQTFQGTYTIGGSNPNYPSINAAVMALKAGVVVANTEFLIRPGTYNEQVSIPVIPGAGETSTVTFRSSTGKASDVIISSNKSGTTSHHTLQLNACSHIIVEDITVINTSSASASGIHITSENTSAEFNTIRDCVVVMDTVSTNQNLFGITVSGITINTTGINNACNYNTIENNFIKGGSSGIQVYASFFSVKSDNLIRNNVIRETYLYGIETRTTVNTVVSGNRVRMRDVPRSECFGLYFYYDANSLYCNNMVEGGFAKATDGAGIYLYFPLNNTRLYHNSVYYESASAFGAAFQYNGWQNCEIANNIFYNAGEGYAFYSQNNIYQDVCLSDYNNLYTNGDYIGYWKTNQATLQDFRTASAKEANSISVYPDFISPVNLHTFNPLMNNKGTLKLDVPEDFEGDTRSTTAPDIGADEYTPWNIDVALTGISISGIPSVKDSNMVSILMQNKGASSLKDSVFYVSYSYDGGISWSPPEMVKPAGLLTPYSTETYNFKTPWSIAKPGMFTLSVRINPPGLPVDLNKLNDTASTAVCVGLGGVYSVGGASSDFLKLNDAVKLLSCGGVSAPVVLNLQPGIYEEKIRIDEIAGASDMNRITIRSVTGKASDVTIIAAGSDLTTDHHVIRLNGADYVTLENLTIINTSSGPFVSGVHLTNGADYNTITGCTIRLDSILDDNRYRLCIVTSSPADIFGIGNNANYTTITNNLLDGGSYGMRLCGLSSAHTQGNRVTGNRITNSTFIGIRTYLDDVEEISGNTLIQKAESSILSYGIYVGYSNSNLRITNNYITNPGYLGIIVDYSIPSETALIANNMIAGGFKDTSLMARGIYLFNSGFMKVAHNSVLMDRENSAAFSLGGANSSDIMVYNNIFYNAAKGYAYHTDNLPAVIASDFNDLYSDSTLAFIEEDRATLEDLQAASAMEQNSVSVNPAFFTPLDLHLKNAQLDGKGFYLPDIFLDIDGDVRNTSVPDIGADEFTMELSPNASLLEILSPANNSTIENSAPVSIRIKNSGSIDLSGFKLAYTVNGSGAVEESFNGTLLPGTSEDFTFQQAFEPSLNNTYTICAEVIIPNDSVVADNKKCITVQYLQTGIQNHMLIAGEVYPNPAGNLLYIPVSVQGHEEVNAELYDLYGKKCYSFRFDISGKSGILQLNLPALPSAVYQLKLVTSGHTILKKVLIKN